MSIIVDSEPVQALSDLLRAEKLYVKHFVEIPLF